MSLNLLRHNRRIIVDLPQSTPYHLAHWSKPETITGCHLLHRWQHVIYPSAFRIKIISKFCAKILCSASS